MDVQAKQLYQFGAFQLDAEEGVLRRDGAPVPLPPKAFDVLLVLIAHHGHIVEKEALINAAWPDAFVEEGNLPVNVSLLRKVLGDDRQNGNRYIETVPRRGYRFVAPVEVIAPVQSERAVREVVTQAPELAAEVLVPQRRSKRWLYVLFAGVALVALVVFALRPTPGPPPLKFRQITQDGHNKSGPIVTDGTRLYFTETVDGQIRPFQVLTSGGEVVPVSNSLHDFFLSDISRDRSELLGGSPRRLGSLQGRDATWSPDGRQIAYLDGSRLFVADSDGSEAHVITTLPKGHHGFYPRWSPGGDSLRFVIASSGDNATCSLWEISADGKGLRQLLSRSNLPPSERDGNWTSDGKWFVFASDQNGKQDVWALRQRLIRIPMISDEPIQLTSGAMDFQFPTPSKDEKQVFAIGEQQTGELSRYDAAHGVFEPYPSGLSATWVSFTRDSEWIGYLDYPQGTLWRMRRDGSDKKQLTFAPTKVSGYSWSPDGTRLAICEPWKIGLVERDGGPISYLISSSLRLGIPTWSHDGSRLVFGEVPLVFGQDDGTHTIHIFDLKTKQTLDLPGSKGLWTPRWSPDGRYIAALKITTQELMLFDWETKRWRDLDAGPVDNPTWSSDSRYVYYDTPPGGAPDAAIYRVRIADGHLGKVTSLGGLRRAVTYWSGLDWDDSPLIVRDIGIQEIYALDVNWP